MFRKKPAEVDPRTLMLPLLPARPGANGYTYMERYADFRAVFFSGTATGQQRERVLFQILAIANINSSIHETSVEETFRALGRRDVGLEIMRILTIEPRSGAFTANERAE